MKTLTGVWATVFMLQLLLLFTVHLAAVEQQRLNKTQLDILEQAKTALEEENPQLTLETLARWKGDPHPTQLLIKGHACSLLERWDDAATAYSACLKLHAEHEQAAMALINCLLALERWRDLKKLLQTWAPPQSCSLRLLKLSIHCARSLEDQRWASVLIETGLLRFSDDSELRLMDIEVLLEQEQWTQVQAAVKQVLPWVKHPQRFWQLLAYACQQNGQQLQALAAYEAAVLIAPKDQQLRREHARAQLAAGHGQEALAQYQILMQQQQPQPIITAAVQAAHAAGSVQQAAAWLKLIPEEKRDDRLRSLALQFDQKLLDKKYFSRKVDRLLARGAIDAQNCLWLGYLAEQDEAWGRAEMLYQLAREQDSNNQADRHASQMASLYLARLWHAQQRGSEAQRILEQHLKAFPDDWQARRLLQLISE